MENSLHSEDIIKHHHFHFIDDNLEAPAGDETHLRCTSPHMCKSVHWAAEIWHCPGHGPAQCNCNKYLHAIKVFPCNIQIFFFFFASLWFTPPAPSLHVLLFLYLWKMPLAVGFRNLAAPLVITFIKTFPGGMGTSLQGVMNYSSPEGIVISCT